MPHKNSSARLFLTHPGTVRNNGEEQQREQREKLAETTASGSSEEAQPLLSPDLVKNPRLYFG